MNRNNLSDVQLRAPTSFLGNIGESLDIGLWNEDDYEEEVHMTISVPNQEVHEVSRPS